ncbi:MAG: response regulator [Acidobacteriota bacterium]|nr:response regulator [Acidobacteriota bacterium]
MLRSPDANIPNGRTAAARYLVIQGLDLIAREHPDVAIIDIGLPELDGYQLARRVGAHHQGARMMLVALTGYGSPLDRDRSVEAGFDHHLVKPVDFDELGRLLDARAATPAYQQPRFKTPLPDTGGSRPDQAT